MEINNRNTPEENMTIRYCRKCGAKILEGAMFCNKCGSKIIDDSVCPGCGRQIAPGSIYCHYCGTKLNIAATSSTNNSEPVRNNKRILSINGKEKVIIGVIGAIVLATFIIGPVNNTTVKKPPQTTVNETVKATENSKSSTDIDETKESKKVPMRIRNGQYVKTCGYRGTCPFKVNAGTGSNYYIIMKYIGAPRTSTVSRESKSGLSGTWKSDFSFYVEGGKSAEIDVPIGKYEMYYACGNEFYGHKDMFGEDSRAYKADAILEFYASDNNYNGHEITLYPVVGGNLETDNIDISDLPVLE